MSLHVPCKWCPSTHINWYEMRATPNTPLARQAWQCKGSLEAFKGQGLRFDQWAASPGHRAVTDRREIRPQDQASASCQLDRINRCLGHSMSCRQLQGAAGLTDSEDYVEA